MTRGVYSSRRRSVALHYLISLLFLTSTASKPDGPFRTGLSNAIRNGVPSIFKKNKVKNNDKFDFLSPTNNNNHNNFDTKQDAPNTENVTPRPPPSHDFYSYKRQKSPLAALGKAIQNNPEKVGRAVASGVQLGLVFYLVRSLWKAASEVMNDLVDEYSGDNDSQVRSSSGGNSWLDRDQVDFLVEYLSQSPENRKESLKRVRGNIGAIQIAQSLHAIGLPLKSADADVKHRSSVESILSQVTSSEAALLLQCLWVPPKRDSSSSSSWKQLTGLSHIQKSMLDTLSTMLGEKPNAFASLFEQDHGSGGSRVSGVLLYGPPGCGKTMLVKGLSSVAKLPCIVVTPSVLLRKYVGDTNLQIRTLFSLTAKLAPCIICIDELDGLFRERSDSDHQVSRDLKTEFLQWIDGMMSDHATLLSLDDTEKQQRSPILLIGATNRPFDVDSAVLRRLPQSHFVGLPNVDARYKLLTKLLANIPTDDDLDLYQIAAQSEGYTPSDLKQLLRTAVLDGPMKDDAASDSCLTMDDIIRAFDRVRPTFVSQRYKWAMSEFSQSNESLVHSSDSSGSNGFTARDHSWIQAGGKDQFYHAGTVEVDNETFDSLSGLLDNNDDSEGFDNDDDDDDLD